MRGFDGGQGASVELRVSHGYRAVIILNSQGDQNFVLRNWVEKRAGTRSAMSSLRFL